jgi:hypothetical protein
MAAPEDGVPDCRAAGPAPLLRGKAAKVSEPSATVVVLPELTDRNRHFWQGGERGELVFLRCQDCGYYLHPPIPVCPRDQSKDVRPEAVSGRATLSSYTVNHHPWLPGFETPYVVAIVEMPEQTGLRLTTNLVNCPIEEIRGGMTLRVVFRHHEDPKGDVWLPLFEPDPGAEGGPGADADTDGGPR